MKSLSQSEYGDLRSLYENVYAPKFESILDEFTDEDLDDLTDEYIEEQVTEFFQECLEEGLDIEIVEQTICESIDSSLDLLTERVDPKETQRRRTQAKDRLATGRAMKAAAAKPKSSAPERDAGAEARARLASKSSDKKANRLAQVKGAVKKVGKAVQGGVGLAARAVGTAQRAGSAVKSAAKKGYERGRQGSSGGGSSTSSAGSSTSSAGTSSAGSSTSSAGTSSAGSSSSSDSGSSSSASAPRKRRDGLLKRGLKKLVRGAAKAVSVGAGAVKAGADYVADKARKEELEATGLFSEKEIEAIMEAEMIDEDSRRMSNKQHTQRVRSNIKSFGSDYTPPSNYDPDANRGQGEVLTRKQIEKKRRKALRQEEVEQVDENRRSARAAGGYKDDSKKQPDPSKDGFTGIGNMSIDAIRKMSARIEKEKTKKEEVEAVDEALTGERYKAALKKGKQYSRKVSEDPAKRATRGGRGGESDFGAGDRGTGNRSRRRRGMSVGDED
tara:strand:- start:58 stop:1557 length:1500 start_codon:yes stop_codon:yes gene_type:complete